MKITYVRLVQSVVLAAMIGGTAAQAPTVTLEFEGGSLSAFAEMIRKAGSKVNIVLPAVADEVDVPRLQLTDAPVESALRAVGNIVTSHSIQVLSLHEDGRAAPVYSVSVRAVKARGQAAGATTQTSLMAGRKGPIRVVSVHSLRNLTERMPDIPESSGVTMKPETVLTAIDTGLAIDGGDDPKAEIRYHAESGLVFVRSTHAQASMVQQVLSNLENDVERRRIAARRSQNARDATPGAKKSKN